MRKLWRLLPLMLVSLLFFGCAPKEDAAAERTAPVAEGAAVAVQVLSREALPSGLSQTVLDWLDECDGRSHLTDAVLFTVRDGFCEALIYCTDLEEQESYRAEYVEGVLFVYAQPTAGKTAQTSLLYVRFSETAAQPRIKLIRGEEAEGVILTRCGEDGALLPFRTAGVSD